MSLANIIRRRLLLLILVVFGVTLVTFAISHMIPGDPARMMAGERASDEIVEKMRENLGLNKPVAVQYAIYVGQIARGDFGTSIRTQRPVISDIKKFFPATIELALAAMLFAIIVGVPLGVISAVSKDRLIDHLSRSISVVGISTPAFWLGLLMILVFYGQLGILPGSGRIDGVIGPPTTITGFYTIDAALTGNWPAFKSAVQHLILPGLTLGFLHLGVVTRQIRSAMLEVMSEDYVRTARASGLSRRQIIYGHALRNALIPSITMIGLAFGDLLYGAVLTETVFAWPGMGAYVVQSISSLDFPAIMAFTVVASTAYVLINLFVDLIYMVLDPQIREVG
ncbi:ABC transporter permease [Frigidibacter sp. ROC022]|uniref:ABC transporter permease n=1 Tax=Frigidibacter sp. ROC022 TaxID=2971796 RepID=UPI00215B7391|nr:ABC transporter permease [Frigidibacter sp. ROC022]MCR8725411.1 ABC transporter permease [Frigidibacter sp. ROC022]